MGLIVDLEELVKKVEEMRVEGVSREEATRYLREQCRVRRGYFAIVEEVYGSDQSGQDI